MSTKVWIKGDYCLAPWTGDNDLHKAVISKIIHSANGQVFARVKYDGYKTEGKIELSKLKMSPVIQMRSISLRTRSAEVTISAQSSTGTIFKPLTGNEEEQRMREKFARLEAEECQDRGQRSNKMVSAVRPIRKKTPLQLVTESQKPGTSYRKRRKPVEQSQDTGQLELTDRQTNQSEQEYPKKSSENSRSKRTKEVTVTQETLDLHYAVDNAGFDSADMEKPKFEFPAVGPKNPFILSSSGTVYQIPATINQYLRDYQRDGVQFLYDSYIEKTGAILGDDMGLGKTVQVIGFLSAMLRKQGNKDDVIRLKPKFIRELSDTVLADDSSKHQPFLIIGPGSVLYNWLDELETWGYFNARKFHGNDKAQTLTDLKKGKIEIAVTTYETFRDNVADLNSIKWCAVIVDEVHRIKGLNSQTTAALRKIKTPCRFGLTGTALQNNLTELWAILDWARPGYLGNVKQFESDFVKKIEQGQKHDATKRELAEARKCMETFGALRNKMMIRRTKQIIADQLPEKDDNIVFCKLTDLQMDVYKAILTHPDLKLILSMDEPCDCGSQLHKVKCCHGTTPDGTPVRSLMFSYMSLLMKTANHVALLIPNRKTSEAQRKRAEEICRLAFQNHPHFIEQAAESSFRTLSDPKYCGKMKILDGLLSVFQKRHGKVLLFSYSTKLLDIVEQYVISVGYEFRRIDGTVNNKKRMETVREFNKDQNIFICLISTKAGGLGLNLTGANVVIIFDPNWNPSYDLQAQDRAYRIGQRRNVQVFRLISAGTIEENIYLRQVYKQQLDTVAIGMTNARRYFHGIQGDKEQKGELFGLKNMFSLRTGEHCLTMDILKRNENLETGLKKFEISEYLSPSTLKSDQGEGTEDSVRSAETSDDVDDFMDIFLNSEKDSTASVQSGTVTKETAANESTSVMTITRAGKGKGIGKGDRKEKTNKVTTPLKQKSFLSVKDVLENSGVVHVHANKCVVGGSKAEDHMSKCAVQDVFELHLNSQQPAMQCQPLDQSDSEVESEDVKGKKTKTKSRDPDYNQSRVRTVDETRVLIGQTPKAIKREHFYQLAAFLECKNTIELAEKVLQASTQERIEMLNHFYESQKPELAPLFVYSEINKPATKDNKKATPKSSSKSKNPVKGKQSQKIKPIKLFKKNYHKEIEYDSSEVTPSNISQSDFNKPSTSAYHGNTVITDQSDFKKTFTSDNDLDKDDNLEEMYLGSRSLPRQSPVPRNRKFSKTKTRTRVKKSYIMDAKCKNNETAIDDQLSDIRCVESLNSIFGNDVVFESIPVDKLLDEMACENISTVIDNSAEKIRILTEHTDKEPKIFAQNSTETFSVVDDIFLTKKKALPRRPAPNSKSVNKEKTPNKNVSINTAVSQDTTANLVTEQSSSIDIFPGATLRNKSSLDLFGDSSKWKKRERKRPKATKPDTVTERVDKLISKVNQDYDSMFTSGKMRKVSHKNDQKSVTDTEKDLFESFENRVTPKEKQFFPNSQSLSLFSGK